MKKRKSGHPLLKLLVCGITLSSGTLIGSLFYYFHTEINGTDTAAHDSDMIAAPAEYQHNAISQPVFTEINKDSSAAGNTSAHLESVSEPSLTHMASEPISSDLGSNSAGSNPYNETSPTKSPDSNPETLPYVVSSKMLGNISDLTVSGYEEDTSLYLAMLDTNLGPMIYYNQGDKRWGNYLYGGADPLKKYGCGPTAAAMIISSFSPQGDGVTPIHMADWAAANGGYAPQSGSYHSMIPRSLSSFGLHVKGVELYSEKAAAELLRSGHILVALMGEGALTKNGHFIIITKILDNGNVYIADPNSFNNSTKEWNLAQLMNELKGAYDSGGPLWAVRYN